MHYQASRKTILLPLAAALLLALTATSALAKKKVTLTEGESEEKAETENSADSPAFHRKLWDGSFDRAGDASGAAAAEIENADLGDCNDYLKTTPAKNGEDEKRASQKLYWACMDRKEHSAHQARQARSIQKQQKVFSVISKASDVAAVGAVGATIYSELGVKTNNQSSSYDKAANIQKKAGQVNYVTGAADFTMGAYAYVAHKNKLEQMKRKLSAETDPALASSLTNAAEAAKSAAYSHMVYGAGKMAAGYASIYLAKRSREQADKMHSIEELQYYNAYAAQQGQLPAQAARTQYVVAGSSQVPYYTNNQPSFTMPDGSTASQPPTNAGVVPYSAAGNSSGSSVSFPGSMPRNPASVASGKSSASGGGGGGDSSGASSPPADDSAKENVAKEAIGSSFDMQLTGGGIRNSAGPSGESGKDEVPNLAALMGANGDPLGKPVATGLSPNQMYQDALEGTDGTEQGSMAGVNGKGDASLFMITKQKLNKMFETGNVGIPKNVEVKN